MGWCNGGEDQEAKPHRSPQPWADSELKGAPRIVIPQGIPVQHPPSTGASGDPRIATHCLPTGCVKVSQKVGGFS